MKFDPYTYIGPLNDKRCRAFRFEAMQYGISLRDDCMIESGNWEIEAGHTGVKRQLALTQRPTAVFAAADRLAVQLLLERIRNPQRENVIHTLPTKLIVRKSTGKVIKQ